MWTWQQAGLITTASTKLQLAGQSHSQNEDLSLWGILGIVLPLLNVTFILSKITQVYHTDIEYSSRLGDVTVGNLIKLIRHV